MDELLGIALLYLAIASGLISGIYVGTYLALAMVGQFVDETLSAVKSTTYELLANPTVQSIVRVADKWKGGGGGMLEGIVKRAAKWVGFG